MVEIFVNSTQVDLIDNVSIPITYSISDIKNPQSREGTYSKTITLPGTKTNNKLFSNIFKIDKLSIAGDFNPNLKADCLILEQSIEILRGSLRLLAINYLENGEISYECAVFGETTDLFLTISNKKLTDLDLSSYNHNWTQANVINSWSATKGQGYLYPMIDYGSNTDSTRGTWKVTDFFPAIYAKQYVDKIFSEAGYTYTSTFFDSSFFKSLIIPFNKSGMKLLVDDILSQYVDEGLSANENHDFTLYKDNVVPYRANGQYTVTDYAFNLENKDAGNNYSAGVFTAPRDGYYNFNISFWEDSYTILTYPTGTSSVILETIQYNVDLKKNNSVIFSQGVFFNFGGSKSRTPLNQTIFLNKNDTVTFDLRFGVSIEFNANILFNSTCSFRTTISTLDSYFKATLVETLAEGSTIPIKSIIPENVLCKDFLASIIKMFNLYVEPDKNNLKNLIIKTRDSFYDDETGVLDWSNKVNKNIPYKITPLGELDFKRLIIKYKDDGDYLNKKYKNSWQENFGTKTLNINNDFLTADRIIEPIFSATPATRTGSNTRLLPQITTDSNTTTGSNIRIISYYGTKSTTSWGLTSTLTSTSTQTVYPFANMVDDADLPTLDLSFDVPFEIYWTMNQANYTTNNLYNNYFRRMFEEITDQDSKLIECEVFLTAQDIANINFAKRIFIDDNYFILNKIIDADRANTNLVKCELLKLKYGR